MTWQIDDITLPDPIIVRETNSANTKTYDKSGGLPIITVVGKKTRTVTLEGILFAEGQNKADLESNYISPLKDKVGQLVTLSAPDSRYDGQYILESFEYREEGCAPIFRYMITLIQGSSMVVI